MRKLLKKLDAIVDWLRVFKKLDFWKCLLNTVLSILDKLIVGGILVATFQGKNEGALWATAFFFLVVIVIVLEIKLNERVKK